MPGVIINEDTVSSLEQCGDRVLPGSRVIEITVADNHDAGCLWRLEPMNRDLALILAKVAEVVLDVGSLFEVVVSKVGCFGLREGLLRMQRFGFVLNDLQVRVNTGDWLC